MKNKLFSLAALCIMACISEPGYADVRDGLVAYWPMDVFTNDVTPDMTANGNDLTDSFTMTGTDFVPSPRGNAASFDGTSKYLSRSYNLGQDTGLPAYNARYYTIAMWVKGSGSQVARTVFSEAFNATANPLFRLSTDNAVSATVHTNVMAGLIRNDNNNTFFGITNFAFADQGRSTLMPFDNTWHHLAWVDSNGVARVYVDGQLDPRVFVNTRVPEPIGTAGSVSLNTVCIAGILNSAGASSYFNGQIDDVAVWERPLSQNEINSVRTNGIATPIAAAAPAMVVDPVGNTNLLVGENFAMIALASGTHPRTFQWYKDGFPLADIVETNEFGQVTNAPIVGTTSNLLVMTNLQAGYSGNYSVVVANGAGSVTSGVAAVLIGTVVPQQANLTNSQISYWPMDAVQGITTPDVVHGYDMVLINGLAATNLAAGKFGNAMKFYTNGVGMLSRTHSAGEALPITQYPDFTISAWVNGAPVNNNDGSVTATGGGRRIITECRNDSSQPTFSLANGDNNSSPRGPLGKLRAFVRNNNNQNNADAGASGTDAYDGNWHHVVYRQRYVGGALPVVEASWFIDGVKDDPIAFGNQLCSPRLPLSLQNTSIGGQNRAGSLGFQFIGLIDDVAVWNRALTAQEITMLSTNVVPPAPPILPNLNITTFKGDFADVASGDAMKLSWTVVGLSGGGLSLSIDQGIGNVLARTTNGIGSIIVSNINSTTTYTLTAQRGASNAVAQTTVTVIPGVAAGWTALDNFQSYSVGPLANPYWSDLRGGCTVDDLSGNRMLEVAAGGGNEGQMAVLPLASVTINQGQARTIFARVYVADDPASTTILNDIGVTDKALRTHADFGTDTGPIARLNTDITFPELAVGAYNDVGGPLILTPRKLEQQQVYNLWIDVTNGPFVTTLTSTNTGDTFSVYIQRLGETGRMLIVSNYVTDRDQIPDFLGPVGLNLDKLVLGNGAASGTVYFDDLFISKSGYNSTVPVAWAGPTPPALPQPTTFTADFHVVPGSIQFAWDMGALTYAPTITGPWTVVPGSFGFSFLQPIETNKFQSYFRIQR